MTNEQEFTPLMGQLYNAAKDAANGKASQQANIAEEDLTTLRNMLAGYIEGAKKMSAELYGAYDRAERAEAELAALREANRWIPVSERLPENEDNYLTLSNCGEVFVMCWNEYWYSPFDENGDESVINVSHWRPLPELPESETKR